MSSFCTSCGAAYRGNSFCTSCGAVQNRVEPVSAVPASVDTPKVSETSDAQLMSDVASQEAQISDGTKTKSKTKLILVAAAVIVFAGSSSGAFFLGKSSVDLETEKKTSYDSGYNAGDSAGYERGDSAGYSRGDSDGYSRGDTDGYSRGDSAGYDRGFDAGKAAGCDRAYSFRDGSWDQVEPYNPYTSYNRHPGDYYNSRSDC